MSLFIAKAILMPGLFFFGSSNVVRVYNDDFAKSQKETFKINNVKAVTGYTYNYTDGTPTKNGIKSMQEKFDQKGNRIEEIWYEENGKTSAREATYTFNDEGIELRNVGMSKHKAFYNNWLYEVNDTAKTIVKYHQQYQLNKEKWVYNYDASGNKTQEQYYDIRGEENLRFVFKYDEKGRLSEKIQFDGYDNLYSKWIYTYDENGNNLTQTQYNSDSEIQRLFTMKYDDKGNLTTRFELNSKGRTESMTVFLYEFYTASK